MICLKKDTIAKFVDEVLEWSKKLKMYGFEKMPAVIVRTVSDSERDKVSNKRSIPVNIDGDSQFVKNQGFIDYVECSDLQEWSMDFAMHKVS